MSLHRKLLAVVAALSTLAGVALVQPSAFAVADNRVDAVGGGAAGLEINVESFNPIMDALVGNYQEVPIDVPAVTLPYQGSPLLTAQLTGYSSNGVSVGVVKVSTEGNLDGTPYAHSTTSVANVTIPGTTIKAVSSECTWDAAYGARATTTIYDVNGSHYSPKPNKPTKLGGSSYLVLNEQTIDEWEGRAVIYVNAVHLHLTNLVGQPLGTYVDIAIGMASCDPLKVPTLSGLKLGGGGG